MKPDLFHSVLLKSFENPSHVNGLVENEITRNRSFGSKERREMTDLIYDSMRWRRRIFGDIPPSHIAIEAVLKKLEEARALKDSPPLAKWNALRVDEQAREVSFPTWIYDRWIHQFGFPAAASVALALNEPASVVIRTNTLKSTREKLKKTLEKEDVPSHEGKLSPWALILEARKNLKGLESFRAGHFEIQDEASQVAALAADAKPGDLVVDACAGAGGKSLALAASMENKGRIVALDSDSRKLPELEDRVKRSGVRILQAKWVAQDDPTPVSELQAQADVVFVDAPCSALGTLRRKPWMKWSLTAAQTAGLAGRQRTLLDRYAPLLKPSGRLVYVTCTINAEENERIIETFLRDHPEFHAAGPARLLRPDTDGTDGFFIAVLNRGTPY